MISRRYMLQASVLAGLLSTRGPANSQRADRDGPVGVNPGDDGYKHHEFHLEYQTVFRASGKCPCKEGECRATLWRQTLLGSLKGFDVLVNGVWYALPEDAWTPAPDKVPETLRQDPAHVCAYVQNGQIYIPCYIITATMG